MQTCQDISKIYSNIIEKLDLDLILANVLNQSRAFILAHPETKITSLQAKKIAKLIKLRRGHWPLAYLLGQKEFYGLPFLVNKNTLVPRPETELIVDEVVNKLKDKTKATVVDIGTGSGCIIISLAKQLAAKKNIKFFGLDISDQALVVAKKNAKLNGAKNIKFICRGVWQYAPTAKKNHWHDDNLVITANLPYLTPTQIKNSPTIKHEPKLALDGGRDGLKYYRELARQIKILLPSSQPITIYCEIDPSQVEGIKKIWQDVANQILIKKDLARKNRLAIIIIY